MKWLEVCTSVVIGPGLGRDEETARVVLEIVKKIVESENIPLVGDADFLWYLTNSQRKEDIIQEVSKLRQRAILTPNVVEFSRFYNEKFDVKA